MLIPPDYDGTQSFSGSRSDALRDQAEWRWEHAARLRASEKSQKTEPKTKKSKSCGMPFKKKMAKNKNRATSVSSQRNNMAGEKAKSPTKSTLNMKGAKKTAPPSKEDNVPRNKEGVKRLSGIVGHLFLIYLSFSILESLVMGY